MSGKKLHIILLFLVGLMLSSCSIRRFVPEGKYLVRSNNVEIEGKKTKISKSALSSYITLKPYKSTFQTNLPIWVYYKSQQRPKSNFWKWMNTTFGKEPVYYDPAEAKRSTNQMERYLDKVGYFHSKVTHTVKYQKRKKKARVYYHVTPSQPYTVSHVDHIIEDSLIRSYILRDSARFRLDSGDIYNAFELDKEREIITERMKNSGYFFFSRDNIFYEVDSNFMNHTLTVTMKLKKSDLAYKKYYINKISIYPDYSIFRSHDHPTDSTLLIQEVGQRKRINHLHFYYFNTPQVKPSAFSRSIMVLEDFPYNQRSVTSTYRALSNFRLYNNVNIEFDTVNIENDSLNRLNCRITMQQNDVHCSWPERRL